jgi:hypothetical protein
VNPTLRRAFLLPLMPSVCATATVQSRLAVCPLPHELSADHVLISLAHPARGSRSLPVVALLLSAPLGSP